MVGRPGRLAINLYGQVTEIDPAPKNVQEKLLKVEVQRIERWRADQVRITGKDAAEVVNRLMGHVLQVEKGVIRKAPAGGALNLTQVRQEVPDGTRGSHITSMPWPAELWAFAPSPSAQTV
jgi:hypothetical protein